MGYVSRDRLAPLAMVGPDFAAFTELSKIHGDGWGIARDQHGVIEVEKDATAAAESSNFESETAQPVNAALLHLRWATPGLAVSAENAHPFSDGQYALIHNGAFEDFEGLAELISPQRLATRSSTGDSELYFLAIMSSIDRLGFRDGALSAITEIGSRFKYSSMNAMLLGPDQLFVISKYDPARRPSWSEPDYYELRYRQDNRGILVASSSWPQPNWTLLPNEHALLVNRVDLTSELIDLLPSD